MRPTRCRGETCGMDFFWVECIRRDGKISRMPLDLQSSDVPLDQSGVAMDPAALKGQFVYVDSERVRASVCGDCGPFYTGHHATCPDADDFRGKK